MTRDPKSIVELLSAELDKGLVSERVAFGESGKVPYLKGNVVIDQANRIFGFSGWSSELIGEVTREVIALVNGATGEIVGQRTLYRARVMVTVDDRRAEQ